MEGHRRGVAGGASSGAGVLLVAGVARLTVIEPCRLAAVMRAGAGVERIGARRVTVPAAGAGAQVRVGAVGVRDRVGLVHRLVEVAALAAGRARGREARGVLAGVVARPARPTRVALEPRVAPRAPRISRRATGCSCHSAGTPTDARCTRCHTGFKSYPGRTCWSCHYPGQDTSSLSTPSSACSQGCHLYKPVDKAYTIPYTHGADPHLSSGAGCRNCHATSPDPFDPGASAHHRGQATGFDDCQACHTGYQKHAGAGA